MSASVFPARAGMSPTTARGLLYPLSVPRASGDEPMQDSVIYGTIGCSPRERG